MTKIKPLISSFIKSLMFYTGIFSLIRILCPRDGVAILRYHSVSSPENNPSTEDYSTPDISIDPAAFENHATYFSTRCKTISLDEVVDSLQKQIPVPKNSVVFTFDDGYADNYDAYKILKKCGATGVFYVTAGCIDNKSPLWLAEVRRLITRLGQAAEKELRLKIGDANDPTQANFDLSTPQAKGRAIHEITALIKSHDIRTREDILNQLRRGTKGFSDHRPFGDIHGNAQTPDSCGCEPAYSIMLTWAQLREMSEDGMTISSHTMTHCNLPNAQHADVIAELSESKALLERELGMPIKHFSYPNSGPYEYYNGQIKEAVKASGYISATTSSQGLATIQSDLFELQRIRTVPHLPSLVYAIEIDERFVRALVQGLKKLWTFLIPKKTRP